jgi:hypothetical protein
MKYQCNSVMNSSETKNMIPAISRRQAPLAYSSALKIDVMRSSEESMDVYRTTRLYKSEDSTH